MIYIYIGVILLIVISFFISYYLMRVILFPKKYNIDETFNIEIEKNNISHEQYNSLNKEDFIVETRDHYSIHCTLLKSPQKSKKFIIISHGITYSRFGSIKYAFMFLKMSYNVLIYDLRNHGMNADTYTTMGLKESEDLNDLVDYLYKQYGQDLFIGLHGESLGAATSLMSLKERKKIHYIISDCSYSTLEAELSYHLKLDYHLPAFFLKLASLLTKMRYGFYYKEINLLYYVSQTNVPILFIHGKADHFTPTKMSEDLYKASQGFKELYLVDDAKHALSYNTDKENYEKTVIDFVTKVEKNHL